MKTYAFRLISALLIAAWAAVAAAQPARTGGVRPNSPAALPTGVQAMRDLPYARVGDKPLLLDLYLPQRADGPLPLIVWVHGGGWAAGDKADCRPALRMLERGYAVASVGYRLSGEAIFPAQIEDCKAALRWLRANADKHHLDAQRVGVWGSSAGGHLVALLGTSGDVKEFDRGAHLEQSSRVQAVCDYYGPTDLLLMDARALPAARLKHDAAGSPESRLIGGTLQENKEQAGRANPINYVSADDPPFLIVHGDQDPVVPHDQSRLLFEALKKAGVSVHFHTLKGAGHGQGFSGRELDEMVDQFFDRCLKSRSPATTTPEALQTEGPAGSMPPGMSSGPRSGQGAGRSPISFQMVLTREDANRDGRVTRGEFKGPPQLFERLDRNHDGVLTNDDFDDAPAATEIRPTPARGQREMTSQTADTTVKNLRIDGERWSCQVGGQPLAGILVKPAGKGPFPAILISHGMGSNAASFGMQKAREMVKWGFVCIATDYTHAGGGDRAPFGASPENLRRATACLDVLRSLGDVDMRRVCAYGNSMGAFLTIGLAAQWPDRIAAAAITAGGIVPPSGMPAPSTEMAAGIRTPFLILHGSADTTVPAARSELLKQTLDKNRVPNERRVFEGVSHNLHHDRADEVYRLMREWFQKQGVLRP